MAFLDHFDLDDLLDNDASGTSDGYVADQNLSAVPVGEPTVVTNAVPVGEPTVVANAVSVGEPAVPAEEEEPNVEDWLNDIIDQGENDDDEDNEESAAKSSSMDRPREWAAPHEEPAKHPVETFRLHPTFQPSMPSIEIVSRISIANTRFNFNWWPDIDCMAG